MLLEQERDVGGRALITKRAGPVRMHRPRAWAAFAADDHPVESTIRGDDRAEWRFDVPRAGLLAGAFTLAEAQAMQIEQVESSYQAAIDQPVSFKTAGGIIETFDADSGSQLVLMQAAQGYALAGAVPSGFYWVAANNAHVPFELSDLSGLNQVMLVHGWAAFQKRQMLKAQITAATSVAAVRAIAWS